MTRLHRVLHHREQVLTQLVQVDLIAQCGTKLLNDLCRIIFATVETTINDPLNAKAQGLEECSNHKSRDYNSYCVILMKSSLKEGLQAKLGIATNQSTMVRTITTIHAGRNKASHHPVKTASVLPMACCPGISCSGTLDMLISLLQNNVSSASHFCSL